MKIFKKNILIIAALTFLTNVYAQDQKALFQEWGDTQLSSYNYESRRGEPVKLSITPPGQGWIYSISLKDMEDPYLWYVQIGSQYDEINFYARPTEQPHPTELYSGSVFDEKFKYYRKYNDLGYETKALIVGDFLYKLKKEGSKGKWNIDQVFAKGRYKMLQLKKIKALYNKILNTDHYKNIDEYLAKERAVLKSKTASYNAANQEYINTFNKEAGWAKDDREFSLQEAYRQQAGEVVRLHNSKPYNIKVAVGKNASGTTLKSGEMRRYECNLADLYLVSPSGSKSFLLKPKDYCGKQYHVK